MRYTTIASGSSGNCSYIEGNDTRILVDAGLTGKQVEKGLSAVGVDPKRIDAVVVTHEHIDHVRGVGVLARRYKLPVYATEGTWEGMAGCIGKVPEEQVRVVDSDCKIAIKDVDVEIFPTPHDARQSIGITVSDGEKRVGLATDAGYVTRGMGRRLMGCEGLIFEANHDPHMLQYGPYPPHLKRRIASEKGHLSNPVCGEALAKLCDSGTRQIILAHLSAENNNPHVALQTVESILTERGHEVELTAADIPAVVGLENVRTVAEQCCLRWPGVPDKEPQKPRERIRLAVAPRYEAHRLEEI
ncbi:MBL fold metallo-hydrolase [Heliobacterium mobile]|nr:MBL fold metallo-hydrolase [Heliobacterium mobile]